MVENKYTNRKKDLTTLIVGLVIIVSLNFIGSFAFERFDLTTEKRYTLSETSKDLARNLDDIIYVKVYLEGDFPAGFKRLQDETQLMLDEFRAYAGANLDYEFINPSESVDEKEKNANYKRLYKKGLRPTDLKTKSDDGFSNKIIWPGAIISYQGKEIPIQLLKSQIGAHAEAMLNSSIEALEYEIANAINKLTAKDVSKVAFIEGHGELNKFETASLAEELAQFYRVDRIALNENLNSLTERVIADSSEAYIVRRKYDVIIIAKPQIRFSEKDKFIIDQFVMYGGRVVWLIDQVFASMDSLQKADVSMAMPLELNLDDQLFTYGVRINTNLIQDMQAVPIPIVTGRVGNQPKTELFPWFFFPLLTPANNHPIVSNLNAVKGEFVSSIDTIARKGIHKTPLLQTSKNSKLSNAPTRISLGMLRFEPKPEQFNKGRQTAAVLLEGVFESVYKNRIAPKIKEANEINFKEESGYNKMIVISDGDVAKNYVNRRTNEYLTLGFDKFTRQEFGNKDFMLNVVNYLCDDSGLMSVRAKKLNIRLLNKVVLKESAFKWKMINAVAPIVLIIIFGLAHYYDRKKKYTK